jgi:rhamnosyltransferase
MVLRPHIAYEDPKLLSSTDREVKRLTAHPVASAVVRTFNSQATLTATLESIRNQSVPVEIVVVDSGSTDDTLAIARRYANQIIAISHESFTYGRALNVGARVAVADVHVAVSSHCVLDAADWVATAVRNLECPGAVATCGLPADAEGNDLHGQFVAANSYLKRYPLWGFTNHASAWLASTWRATPFDENLVACEDKEWAWRATKNGGSIIADPRLLVPTSHRRSAGLKAYYRRMSKEVSAFDSLGCIKPYSLWDALWDWCRTSPRGELVSHCHAFGETRLTEVIARYRAGKRK